MIVKGKYVRGGKANHRATASQLKAHVKYIEYRSRDATREGREDRYLFDKEQDHVQRLEVVREIMDHTSSRVSYHKLVLSPAEDEPVHDWREWTRQVMRDLEDAQGKDLHWYAVKHENTDHPHVHIVIAGSGEDRETGREEAVTLYAQDYELLRESGREHSEHEWEHLLSEFLKAYDSLDTVGQDFVVRDQEEQSHFSQENHEGDLAR